MSAEKTLSAQSAAVNTDVNHECEPVRMDVIKEIAAMSAETERPALIWGNTDRATIAAEALWVFARRTGLDGCGDDAITTVQDLIPAINIRRLQAIRISATRKIVLTYVRNK